MNLESTSPEITGLKKLILNPLSKKRIEELEEECSDRADAILDAHDGVEDNFKDLYKFFCRDYACFINRHINKVGEIFGLSDFDDIPVCTRIVFALFMSESVEEISKIIKFMGLSYSFEELVTRDEIDGEKFREYLGENVQGNTEETFRKMKIMFSVS